MPAYAPAALGIAVALSAIGAVTICILIMLYGFTPAGEEPPGQTSRRLLVTRIGHALAAVCFAGTAILIAVVLVRPATSAPPATVPAAAAIKTIADERIPELGAKVSGQETRLSEAEARMQRLERELRERATAPVTAPAPAPASPPASASPPAPASAPAQHRVTPRTSGPTSSAVPNHAATTTRVAASPRPEKPPPASALPLAPSPSSSAASPTPSASPLTETSMSPSAKPTVAPPAAPGTPPAPVAPAQVTVVTPAAPSTSPTRPQHFDLKAKLREDWRAIRRGVDSAPDDFRRTVDETKRRLGIGD
jgi:hypothetical protein